MGTEKTRWEKLEKLVFLVLYCKIAEMVGISRGGRSPKTDAWVTWTQSSSTETVTKQRMPTEHRQNTGYIKASSYTSDRHTSSIGCTLVLRPKLVVFLRYFLTPCSCAGTSNERRTFLRWLSKWWLTWPMVNHDPRRILVEYNSCVWLSRRSCSSNSPYRQIVELVLWLNVTRKLSMYRELRIPRCAFNCRCKFILLCIKAAGSKPFKFWTDLRMDRRNDNVGVHYFWTRTYMQPQTLFSFRKWKINK